jgi:hypothetical protein
MRREAHDAETLLGRVTERGDRNHHSGPDAKRSREQKGDVLGSASATGATSQLGINDRINFKKDGNSVFSATGKKFTSMSANMGKLGSRDASDIIDASSGVLGFGQKLAGTDATTRSRQSDMSFSVEGGSKQVFHTAGNANLTAEQIDALKEGTGSFWLKIYDKFMWLFNKLRNKILTDGDWPASVGGAVIKQLVVQAVKYVVQASAPFIGESLEILKGIASIIDGVAQKLSLAELRSKFEIRDGHPAELARRIEKQMTHDVYWAVADLLKSMGVLAAQVITVGAGSIASALMAAIKWFVQTLMRLLEAGRIQDFLKKARTVFASEPVWSLDPITNTPKPAGAGGIVRNTALFTEFFKEGCKASVIIPMLTLNTGICGSLMTMIRLTNEFGLASRSAHDAGADYFTELKTYGAKYMRDSGFSYKAYSRKEVVLHSSVEKNKQDAGIKSVQGLLNHALNSHGAMSTWKTKVKAGLLA